MGDRETCKEVTKIRVRKTSWGEAEAEAHAGRNKFPRESGRHSLCRAQRERELEGSMCRWMSAS